MDQIFLPCKPSVPCFHEMDPDSLFSGFGTIGGYGPKPGKTSPDPFCCCSKALCKRIFVPYRGGGEGGGGRCLQGNLWYSPPASMTSRLSSVTFKMASKVFIEETDKSFDFITEIPFRFLGFRDFKVSIVIEN